MDTHHINIGNCRELTQAEIDLVNEIKAKGKELLDLHEQVISMIGTQDLIPQKLKAFQANALGGAFFKAPEPDHDAIARHAIAEPRRWALIGKTHLQEGIMALVRAIIQPTEF
ncbi:hypothetical protein IXX78_13595 [Escherichia coli]